MAAVLSISPTLGTLFVGTVGQSLRLRVQVRDDQVRRNYDLTGAGTVVGKLVSLSGGTNRTLANAPTVESLANGVLIVKIVDADANALSAGRWYLELTIPTVTAEGGGTLIPALYPFDAAVGF
jgi:hypothetical protein